MFDIYVDDTPNRNATINLCATCKKHKFKQNY